ncbi:MAG TPA: GTPase HflX [Polyangiaceae bacterium]|jgi:GTP-binding protein HflX
MMKFSSKGISEHAEVPLADEGKWESLVAHWSARGEARERNVATNGNADYVASIGQERDPRIRRAQLEEILSLVRHQGDLVVGHETLHLTEPSPRSLLGKGAAQEVASRARAAGATMLVLDAELTPSQARNLEDLAGIAVCDREAVILNVFLKHARTRRARIQVELAQLEYLKPRIRGVGIDMDQQTGGMARARGPGETASELLARKIDGRVLELEKALRKVETSGATQRRQRSSCHRVALVGYTNAGKTSLMNALTASELSARDVPFETLDTTSRALSRHGGDVVLSDTVGFIRRLPDRLLASFESTLAEMAEASLLVLVVDVSDPEAALHLATTRDALERIGAGDVPRHHVFNKLDRLEEPPARAELARWSEGDPWTVLSCHDPRAVDELKALLLQAVRRDEHALTLLVPYGCSRVLSLAYGQCRVLESDATPAGMKLRIAGPRPVMDQIQQGLQEANE